MVQPAKLVAFVAIALSCTVPAVAQHKGGQKQVTNPKDAGPDFAFVGEYVGKVEIGPGERKTIGLQVVALGDGKFYALQYIGGLPGETESASARLALQGVRKGNSVRLEGWPMEIELSKGFATVSFAGGEPVGELQKLNRKSPMAGACPPCNATVLFDGKNTDHWKNGKTTTDGLLMAGTETKKSYKNFRLHLEYRVPYVEAARDQARGNSGVYLQRRYEVQILDSFGLPIVHNGAGALYRLRAPDINASLPPLTWQSYDIEFRAAKFDKDGRKVKDAKITVCHNGYIIHDKVDILRKTGAGRPEGPEAGPILLQDHGNPVVFRNVWIVDHDDQCDPCDYCCLAKKFPACCDPCATDDCKHSGKCKLPVSSQKDKTTDDCGCHPHHYHHHKTHKHGKLY